MVLDPKHGEFSRSRMLPASAQTVGVRHYDKPQVKQVEDPEIWESGGPIGFAALGQVTLIAVEA